MQLPTNRVVAANIIKFCFELKGVLLLESGMIVDEDLFRGFLHFEKKSTAVD